MFHLKPRRTTESILKNLPVQSLQTQEERQLLCDYTGYSAIPDVRMQVWDIKPLPKEEFAVTGYVSFPSCLHLLQKAAQELQMECDISQVKILPDASLNGQVLGLVIAAECPVWDTQDETERLDTAVYGETVFLLRKEESKTLIHSENGYVGWVGNTLYRPVSNEEWKERMRLNKVVFYAESSINGIHIHQGTELPAVKQDEVVLPTGSSLKISRETAHYVATQSHEQKNALVAVAKSLLTVPYVWGGSSSKGIDCSGLVRYAYSSIGILLPRDADQQFLCGKIVGLPGMLDLLHPGDLLFFAGEMGGVKHVAIAISPERFLHASSTQGVMITRWENESALAETFLLAKRILR